MLPLMIEILRPDDTYWITPVFATKRISFTWKFPLVQSIFPLNVQSTNNGYILFHRSNIYLTIVKIIQMLIK